MPGDVVTPQPSPEFSSLVYTPGFILPEPASDVHRILLWRAAGCYPTHNTESRLCNLATGSLRRDGFDNDTRLVLLKTALRDLLADKLFVADARQHDTLGPGFFNESRTLSLSGLGLQIAGECGRRLANDPTRHFNTRRRGYEIYQRTFRALLATEKVIDPQPMRPVQNTNTVIVERLEESDPSHE